MDRPTILDDLIAEQDALDTVVAALDESMWSTVTPSPGWDISDQIGHLTFFDNTAALSLSDPEAFVAHRAELLAALTKPSSAASDELTLGEFRQLAPTEQLTSWRAGRANLAQAATATDPMTRVEWYGPSMSWRSFLTARLMETWAHGQDIVDSVGAEREFTDRLRHIAQLGVITRGWSYTNRGLTPPDGEVTVTLTAPSGEVWTWGEADGPDRVDGPAEDFCLVVTQRRHVDDTNLTVTSGNARDWMECAQVFAGPPTTRTASTAQES